MHIIKQTPSLLLFSGLIISLSSFANAHEGHDQMMQTEMEMLEQSMQMESPSVDHAQHQLAVVHAQLQNEVSSEVHDHRREHGGQIYQATTVENAWAVDGQGQGNASSKLKTWLGTDENKIFIKAHVEKPESEKTQTEAMALYSHNIADFWDVQTGVHYQYRPTQLHEKNLWSAVVGIHGLAPYFFETEAYLYAGQDQRWQLSLEMTRDVLFTQKLIAQPYLNADVVLSDDSRYARKSGLSKLQTGMQLRYEISKKVMPFIDVAYAYDKGVKQTVWQNPSTDQKGGVYGAGLTFKF